MDNQDNNPQNASTSLITQSSHPIVAIFTIAFKISAVVSFILLDLFCGNEAYVMIVVILLGATDFWVTKNISGRILVGLRWWSNNQKGVNEEKWIFESKDEKTKTKADQSIFWSSLYITLGIWLIFFIWELIRFKFIWSSISLMMLTLSGVNTYGYIRCSKYQDKKIFNFGLGIVNQFSKTNNNTSQSQPQSKQPQV